MRKVEESCAREAGQAITEYALILAVIFLIVFGVLRFVGGRSNQIFSQAVDAFQSQNASD